MFWVGRLVVQRVGGEGEIRTPGTLTRPLVFETSAFNRSATSPDPLVTRTATGTKAGKTPCWRRLRPLSFTSSALIRCWLKRGQALFNASHGGGQDVTTLYCLGSVQKCPFLQSFPAGAASVDSGGKVAIVRACAGADWSAPLLYLCGWNPALSLRFPQLDGSHVRSNQNRR